MRTAKKHNSSKTLQIAFIFFVVVGLLIGLSLIVKVGIIVSRSRFDGQHQFILQVNERSGQGELIVFSPDTHTISLLTLTGSDVSTSAVRTLQLPVDGVVNDARTSDIGSLLLGMSDKDTINILDRIRLFVFDKTVAGDNIAEKSIHLPADQVELDSLSQLTTDQTLYKEAMTISVVNGSGVSGLGNAVAKVLTHVGANVISVTTADDTQKSSHIVYTGNKTYTVNRLSRIFKITPTMTTKAGIADITLIIGEDKGKEFLQAE